MPLIRPFLSLSFGLVLLGLQIDALAADIVSTSVVAGKYGFGYGPNLHSKCTPISKKLTQKFDKCEWEQVEPSSYSQKTNYYTCEIIKTDEEYKIYSSKSRCTEELGTMNANAP